jgi:CheY-like chemotaxis protein
VLVVDDADDVRDLLSFLLARAGAQVQGAVSAAEAFHCLISQDFDLLISDLGMPEEDGYSLVARWRLHEAATRGRDDRMPAVSLTAYARPEDRMRALAAGFDVHLPKPMSPGELVAALCDLLAQADARRRPSATA